MVLFKIIIETISCFIAFDEFWRWWKLVIEVVCEINEREHDVSYKMKHIFEVKYQIVFSSCGPN
jgi:hypothetical protein